MKPTCQLTEIFKVGDKAFVTSMGKPVMLEITEVFDYGYAVKCGDVSGYNCKPIFRTEADLAKHEIKRLRKSIEGSENNIADWEQYL